MTLELSYNAILVFVTTSGCSGHLASGFIESNDAGETTVYDARHVVNPYISDGRLRSWCIVTLHKTILCNWSSIAPCDLQFFSGVTRNDLI